MKTAWDYTSLADAYLKRADYADAAIDAMLSVAGIEEGDPVCDVGAGVAHLTLMLAHRGYDVVAVEPNDAMRENGIARTKSFANVRWYEGTGESTGQPASSFSLVTFGSSFNVCDRPKALSEVSRIAQPKGWFACMWNHRRLDDPIQRDIEGKIKEQIPEYSYGTRREDQTAIINESSLFGPVIRLASEIVHEQSVEECVEAWRSHATLQRQAQDKFGAVVDSIEKYLGDLNVEAINVPYETNIWLAQLK